MNAAELIQRCKDAEDALYALAANEPTTHNGYRLDGKRQGVALVRGYIEEALRIEAGE